MLVNNTEIMTREAGADDLNFILSSWLKSYRESDFGKSIPSEVFFTYHQQLIRTILGQENNVVTILCAPEEPKQILGYIAHNTKTPIVYYVYIKHTFRKLGLGKMLLEKIRESYINNLEIPETDAETGGPLLIQCTHKFKMWGVLSNKHNLVYNPYVVSE